MESMALPISFAISVVLVVAGTLASLPLTGILYLAALVAGPASAYVLLSVVGGHEEEAETWPDGKRPWYGAVEQLQDSEHEDAEEAPSP